MLAKTNKVDLKAIVFKPGVIAFPLIVLVVMVGLGIFVVMPTIRGIMDKRDQVKQEQERLDKLTAKREALESLSAVDMTRDLAILNKVLASRKPIVGIMGSMMGAATGSGVVLQQYELKPGAVASEEAELNGEDKPGVLSALPVSLGIDGVYQQVIAYMRKIQASSPIAKYMTADLSGILGKEEQPQFSQEMEMEVYYAVPPSTKGKLTDPLPPMSPKKEEIIQKAMTYQDYSINLPEGEAAIQFQKPNPFKY